jgi:hypothetical protein
MAAVVVQVVMGMELCVLVGREKIRGSLAVTLRMVVAAAVVERTVMVPLV